MTERLWNQQAEESLLGAMLLEGSAIDATEGLVSAEDFWLPKHRTVFEASLALRRDGIPVDVVTLAERLTTDGMLDAIGGPATLLALQTLAPAVSNAPRYARIIANLGGLRRMRALGHEVASRADKRPENPLELSGWARAELDRLESQSGTTRSEPVSAADLLAEPDEDGDWLIDGWLRPADSMILTAQSGTGKSFWLLQVAVMAASGVHPMRLGRMKPLRVLVCDFENGRRRVRRRLHRLVDHHGASGFDPDRLHFEIVKGGVDISSDSGAAWLRTKVRETKPDLLIIGPYKNMHLGESRSGSDGGEGLARRVTMPIDRLCDEYGLAVLMEAHGPHDETGSMNPDDYRPRGSKFLVNWPAIGACLIPDDSAAGAYPAFNLGRWREDRDDDLKVPKRWQRGGDGWVWKPMDSS